MRQATIYAVLCKDYETDNETLLQGSWKKFKQEARRKNIYLFGGGKGCQEFIEAYGKKINITGIIDNSPTKIGTFVNGIAVYGKDIINNFSEEREAILITAASHMNDIAEEIERIGFKNYYAYALLEAKKIHWRLFQHLAYIYIWKFHRVKKDKILVWNNLPPGGFSCSPKYIVQELIRQKVPCEIVWMTNHSSEGFPDGVRLVKINPYNVMIEHATSKIWIETYKKERWVQKKKNQYYINVWHGGMPFKKIDFDTTVSSKSHLIRTIKDSEMIDIRVSNCEACTNIYRNAMKYKNQVLECGFPRLDILKAGCKDVYAKLGIPEDSSLLLYAPTWRTVTMKGEIRKDLNVEVDLKELRETLEKKFGGDWYILVRPHPAVKLASAINKDDFHIIDASAQRYEDVYELLAETKILISDYSGLIFEAGFFEKPVFILADDYSTYQKEQGIYFDLEKLPYSVASTFQDLLEAIRNFENNEYLRKLKEFHAAIKLNETGEASKIVVEKIKEVMGREIGR